MRSIWGKLILNDVLHPYLPNYVHCLTSVAAAPLNLTVLKSSEKTAAKILEPSSPSQTDVILYSLLTLVKSGFYSFAAQNISVGGNSTSVTGAMHNNSSVVVKRPLD